MPSFNIHLAVAKRYIEKTSAIKDIDKFYKGVIDPDLAPNKNVSHYSGDVETEDLVKRLSEKVLLNKYLEEQDITSDYQKGVFLHLITDYIFYNYFFDKNYLKSISRIEFVKSLYHSYDLINEYLRNKYNIDYSDFSIEVNSTDISDENEKGIISLEKLDCFIEYVSNIDLEEYKNKIIENDINILPIIM